MSRRWLVALALLWPANGAACYALGFAEGMVRSGDWPGVNALSAAVAAAHALAAAANLAALAGLLWLGVTPPASPPSPGPGTRPGRTA